MTKPVKKKPLRQKSSKILDQETPSKKKHKIQSSQLTYDQGNVAQFARQHTSPSEAVPKVSTKQPKKKKTNKKTKKLSSKETKKDTSFDSLLDISCGTSDDEESPSDLPNPILDRSEQRANRLLRKERLRRTVFVGNLPPGVKKNDLRKLFDRVIKQDAAAAQDNCRVESVRFRGVVPVTGGTGKLARKRAVIQGEFSAGVSQSLIAYVVLTSSTGIPASLSLNGHWLQPKTMTSDTLTEPQLTGKHIRVDRAFQRAPIEQLKQSLFLGNLPFDVQEEEVRAALSKFGSITNVRLIRDKETGAVKGFGYVKYADPTASSLAIRSSGAVSVRGRPIRIQEWKSDAETKLSGGKRKHPKSVLPHPGAKKTNKGIPEQNSIDTNNSKKQKSWHRLRHVGQVKGVTLPSNLRGEQRERFLQKRLLKKRKRQLRRQQQQQQAHSSSVADKALRKTSKKARMKK